MFTYQHLTLTKNTNGIEHFWCCRFLSRFSLYLSFPHTVPHLCILQKDPAVRQQSWSSKRVETCILTPKLWRNSRLTSAWWCWDSFQEGSSKSNTQDKERRSNKTTYASVIPTCYLGCHSRKLTVQQNFKSLTGSRKERLIQFKCNAMCTNFWEVTFRFFSFKKKRILSIHLSETTQC